MEIDKAITYIETSFLSELIRDDNITDISYNGEFIFYMHNLNGRLKSNISCSYNDVKDFIRQIANLLDKQFSYQEPFLDISIGKYRLNAIHQSIGRIKEQETITFSLRIASDINRVESDFIFMDKPTRQLLDFLLSYRQSIVIGGLTGTGKTELQKYLISRLRNNERVIIIDNLLELDRLRSNNLLDLNSWQTNKLNISASISSLVVQALRSNPDWLIVAESRGGEMSDVLNSVMTGCPIITTLHAYNQSSIPSRIAHMVMMNEKKMEYDEIIKDINYHFHFYIYLRKDQDNKGKIIRYISSILYADAYGNQCEIFSNNLKTKSFRCINNTDKNNAIIKDLNILLKEYSHE